MTTTTTVSPSFTPTAEQEQALALFATGDSLAIEAGAGTGKTATLKLLAESTSRRGQYVAFNKALRWDQPVATPNGWVPIGKLHIGDAVFGVDGREHAVTKVHDQGIRPMFTVRFSDGTVVVADADHLWTIDRTHTGNTTYVVTETVTTSDVLAHLVARRRVRVPHAAPLVLPEVDLPLDPWLLGVLLGDGSIAFGRVWLTSADEWIIDAVNSVLPDDVSVVPVGNTALRTARTVAIIGDGRKNNVLTALRSLGIYGQTCGSKSVPEPYLWASAYQRLAVLQGLMDTDGCPGTVTPIFTTTSPTLADAVVFLTQSLGGTASKRIMRAATPHWAAAFQVTVRLPKGMCPFRLPSKIGRSVIRSHDRLMRRRIVSVTPIGEDRAVCISIDSADHLFLTAGLIPTHNSITVEAAAKFPNTVACNTAHSLAFRAVGRRYAHRLKGGRMKSMDIARRLRIDPINVVLAGGTKVLQPSYLASLVMRSVGVFCQSADLVPSERHVPYIDGIDHPHPETGQRSYANNDMVRKAIAPALQAAWADILNPNGSLPYTHAHYLKAWHLSDPIIDADYILFDECQDANAILLDIVAKQQARGVQVVWVGDSNQAIYEWTGAVNALQKVEVAHRTYLSQSFRFGPEVARAANVVLAELASPLRLTGTPAINSSIGDVDLPHAILCRTNAKAVSTVLAALQDGRKVHLIGGGDEVVRFAKASIDLSTSGWTAHPELACFSSWGEVQTYVQQDPQGDELRLMVTLVDDFGADVIIDALERNKTPEHAADLVVSTAHKSKGREWVTVKLAADFTRPTKDGEEPVDPSESELRLLYVAATRAQHRLDPSGSAFLTDLLAGEVA